MIRLQPLPTFTCQTCGAQATCRLVDGILLHGYYCEPCGNVARRTVQAQVDAEKETA